MHVRMKALHQKVAEYMLTQNVGLLDFHFATNWLFDLKSVDPSGSVLPHC